MSLRHRTSYHRDGTVTVWDCYAQAWIHRTRSVSDAVLTTLSPSQRARVLRHLARNRRPDDETAHYRAS